MILLHPNRAIIHKLTILKYWLSRINCSENPVSFRIAQPDLDLLQQSLEFAEAIPSVEFLNPLSDVYANVL